MEVDSDEPHDCAPWVETKRVEETTSQPLRFTTFFKAHRAAGSTSFLPIVSNRSYFRPLCRNPFRGLRLRPRSTADPFDHLWRRFCQAGGARNSRQKSAHIPFAV